MRISDWSSDVCSSDLGAVADDRGRQADDRHAAVDIDHLAQAHAARTPARSPTPDTAAANGIYRAAEPAAARGAGPARGPAASALCPAREIGRAPCRARLCQYVEISVVSSSIQNQNTPPNIT